jgi:hypothetical protein
MSELKNIKKRTANILKTSKDSITKDARAKLLCELKILNLHSEYY